MNAGPWIPEKVRPSNFDETDLMNTERKTKNPGSLVEKIATGKANALEIDHDDLLIGKSNLIINGAQSPWSVVRVGMVR